MKVNSPKNLDCKFAPEIVEYIYGEIGNESKNAFAAHLENCADCADLIEDFSEIRFSIQDWKAAEFDKLATPEIKIPYETAVLKIVETEKSFSWFDAVRNYLSLSPVLSGAMAVLLFALLFGLGILVLNKNANNLIVVSNQKANLNVKPSEKPQPSVNLKKQETIKTPEIAKTEEDTINEKPSEQKQKTEVPAQISNRSNSKQKIQPVKMIESKTPNNVFKNDTKNARVVPTTNKPRLNELPEEVEDNSLRLSDLFAELDTRE